MKSLCFVTRLQELLDQSGRIEEGERQWWQNYIMLQETESQASNTTPRNI